MSPLQQYSLFSLFHTTTLDSFYFPTTLWILFLTTAAFCIFVVSLYAHGGPHPPDRETISNNMKVYGLPGISPSDPMSFYNSGVNSGCWVLRILLIMPIVQPQDCKIPKHSIDQSLRKNLEDSMKQIWISYYSCAPWQLQAEI